MLHLHHRHLKNEQLVRMLADLRGENRLLGGRDHPPAIRHLEDDMARDWAKEAQR